MTTPIGPLAPIPGTGPCVAVADGDLAGEVAADTCWPCVAGRCRCCGSAWAPDLDAEAWDDAHPIVITATVGCGTCGATDLMPGDVCCGQWTSVPAAPVGGRRS